VLDALINLEPLLSQVGHHEIDKSLALIHKLPDLFISNGK